MRREYLVGLPAEQKVERLCHLVGDELAHHFVPVVDRPSAQLETTCGIFFRSARSFHDTVERHECVYSDFSHVVFPSTCQWASTKKMFEIRSSTAMASW